MMREAAKNVALVVGSTLAVLAVAELGWLLPDYGNKYLTGYYLDATRDRGIRQAGR